MAKQVVDNFEIDGVTVEIGPAISKDAGLVVVTRHIRNAAWFNPMVDRLLAALPSSPHSAFGFGVRAKLEAGLMALIAGLVATVQVGPGRTRRHDFPRSDPLRLRLLRLLRPDLQVQQF